MRRNCGSSSRNMVFWLATPRLHVRSVGDRFLAQSSCIRIKNIGGACGKGAKNAVPVGTNSLLEGSKLSPQQVLFFFYFWAHDCRSNRRWALLRLGDHKKWGVAGGLGALGSRF